MPSSQHVSQIEHRKTDKKSRRFTLLVLLADTPIESVKKDYGDYHDIFTSLFRRSAQTLPQGLEDYILTVKSYDVVNEPFEYPSQDDLDGAAGLLITGSAASAYESKPWINRLVEYTASLPKSHPSLKIVGICYGHQIVARALGAVVEKNGGKWELGVRTIELTDLGKKLLVGNGAGSGNEVTIHQVHQDHVPALPDNFALLGRTSVCAVQGMVSPASATSLAEVQIFCLQGHPEFSPDVVTKIINAREQKGIISKELAEESRGYAALHDDGVSLGGVILRLIGV